MALPLRRLPQLFKGWAEGGLHVFCLAFFFYFLTVGPASSLWDAGEFVCCAAGLDVGHPPGAPLYWLVLRMAVLLAPHGAEAMACSLVSALSCAAAAMVLSLVAREVALWWCESSRACSRTALFVVQTAAGLTWAFADSVWAVAVETEVYGAACLLGFASLWLALRFRSTGSWRNVWLLCLVVGMTAGVHWLGWLMLPLAAAVACERLGRRAMVVAFFAGCLAVVLLVWLASGHFFDFALLADVLCVNAFGLPVGVGWGVAAVVVPVALLAFAAYWRGSRWGLAATACFLVSLGFLSYAEPILRSQCAALAISSPSDAQRLSDYMARRQYGSRPLFFGPTYASRPNGFSYVERMAYDQSTHSYTPESVPVDYSYATSEQSLFPRMSSNSPEALWAYRSWANPEGWPDSIPSLAANMRFFVSYQLGHMMARYVMWNFCGRQNSEIGDGGYLSGNFITGIEALDEARLHVEDCGSQAEGRYALFGIPLILALAGLSLTVSKARLRLSLLILSWIAITGPGLAFFVNMPPYEPRERDYIFLPLYAALALLVALSLWRIWLRVEKSRSPLLNPWWRAKISVAAAIAVPTFMCASGFASHDRSGDTLVDDMAKSVLDLCPPDAVLVVGGDNDTYPMWYAQQVLGYRRDVRIVNYSLLSSFWHCQSLVRAGRADAPLRLSHADLAIGGRLQSTWLLPNVNDTVSLSDISTAADTDLGRSLYLRSNVMSLPLADTSVVIRVGKESLEPSDLLLLEMAAENTSRRICLMPDVVPSTDLGLDPYLWDVGPLAYLVPDTSVFTPDDRWRLFHGALHLPDLSSFSPSTDEVAQLSRLRVRHMCALVAQEAVERGDQASALLALHSSLSWLPVSLGPLDSDLLTTAKILHECGDAYLSREVLSSAADRCLSQLRQAQSLRPYAPLSSRSIVDDATPFALELLDALRTTGNDDIAVAVADFVKIL